MAKTAFAVSVAVFLCLVASKFDRSAGFVSLIRFGETWKNARHSSLGGLDLKPADHGSGYDGQFYAQIALDPTLRDRELMTVIDAPAYRAQRIAMPALAALIGWGNTWRTLQAFSLINVGCWVATALMVRRITGTHDWVAFARWAGCLFGLGTLDSVRQSLVDLPAMTLVVWLVQTAQQPSPLYATLGGIATLTKETSILAACALYVPGLRRRASAPKALLLLLSAVVPAAAWLLYVRHQFSSAPPSTALGNFTWPFVGVAGLLKDCAGQLGSGNLDSRYTFGLIGAIGLGVQTWVVWTHREPASAWWRVAATYSLLMPFLSLWVWAGYWAAYRAVLPLTFGFNLLLPSNRHFWPLWVAGNLTILHALWRFL